MRVERLFGGFENRAAAGRQLAKALRRYRDQGDAVVVGLPRGGVVTAAVVAEELDLPLDVLVVRRLAAPGNEQLAVGAIGPGGVRVLNDDVIALCGVDPLEIDLIEQRERVELERRDRLFRGDRRPLDCERKTVILVDDGLATGSTALAAIAVLRIQRPARIVLAVPVAPVETRDRCLLYVDELVCLATPDPFLAIGYWYDDFTEVSDEDVIRTLARARGRVGVAA
ncbi:MAG TPA: phosphoribosyltransferase family protein [Thermoanaerobaculia bacterium]